LLNIDVLALEQFPIDSFQKRLADEMREQVFVGDIEIDMLAHDPFHLWLRHLLTMSDYLFADIQQLIVSLLIDQCAPLGRMKAMLSHIPQLWTKAPAISKLSSRQPLQRSIQVYLIRSCISKF
jgi:hypothetical protein